MLGRDYLESFSDVIIRRENGNEVSMNYCTKVNVDVRFVNSETEHIVLIKSNVKSFDQMRELSYFNSLFNLEMKHDLIDCNSNQIKNESVHIKNLFFRRMITPKNCSGHSDIYSDYYIVFASRGISESDIDKFLDREEHEQLIRVINRCKQKDNYRELKQISNSISELSKTLKDIFKDDELD